jgi:hypothetical protein
VPVVAAPAGCDRAWEGGILEHNPLSQQLASLTKALDAMYAEGRSLQRDLDWYARFDRAATIETVGKSKKTIAALVRKQKTSSAKLAGAEELTPELEEAVPIFFPSFREKGRAAQSRLREHLDEVKKLQRREQELATQIARDRKSVKAVEQELAKFDAFDQEQAVEDLRSIEEQLPLRALERDAVAERKEALDVQLKAPVKELTRSKSSLKGLAGEVERLSARTAQYGRDIRDAESMDNRISNAENSYQKKLIHEECENKFGIGSPRGVIGDRKRRVREDEAEIRRKRGQILALERDIAKIEERIQQIGERGAWIIRSLIIDGNNLSYEGRSFIGLAALAPLCRHLAQKYDVTVVFDASIRQNMGVHDADLDRALPEVKVHVVASRRKADETILDIAQDEFVFVVSNDRYAEYREKSAVRENRLIRHEIINGRILIHDLDIDVTWPDRQQR